MNDYCKLINFILRCLMPKVEQYKRYLRVGREIHVCFYWHKCKAHLNTLSLLSHQG